MPNKLNKILKEITITKAKYIQTKLDTKILLNPKENRDFGCMIYITYMDSFQVAIFQLVS